jgi:FtsP/CotA-like multicopper oxidase with cupredoxin domain
MTTLYLARHLQPGDVIIVCGKTQTVSAINHDGGSVHVYVPGHPAEPYAFSDSSLIIIVTRDGQPVDGTAEVPETALTDQERARLEVPSHVPREDRVRLTVERRGNPV